MIEELEVNFSLEHGIVKTKMGWVELGKVEREYFKAVYAAKTPLSAHRLLLKVYGDDGYDKSTCTVPSVVSHINRLKLYNIGLMIKIDKGSNYILTAFNKKDIRTRSKNGKTKEIQGEVFKILQDVPYMRMGDIVKRLSDYKISTVKLAVWNLSNSGKLRKLAKGIYAIPKPSAPQS